ncbi:MAG: serine/threonine-protein phosphatase [Phycisphaerales bacterium]|nr:MAG: serine/threonine-protein phosphatase [Phycisphaerales bacterium]
MSEELHNEREVTSPPDITPAPTGPFIWAAETDPGKIRPENEDTFFADPETALFVVSDGMGGHRGGAVASGIIREDLPVMIENALDRLEVGTVRTVRSILQRAIAEQNRQLQLEGTSETGYQDMGATLVIALLRKRRCFVANVGDSRAYRLRSGRFTQLTRDHSVISELIERGRITPDEATNHSANGQLTHYIGMEQKISSHVRSFALEKRDRILLCTDGLTDMLGDKKIAAILKAETDPQTACITLVEAANRAGGHDNITTLVIDWIGPG